MNRQRLVIMVLATLLLRAAAAAGPDKGLEGMVTRSDFEIVECLLPGQLRQMGAMAYMTPRRPVRTTTSDCRSGGGEYVAYDRADVKSALRIWLAAADSGSAEAQNNVGEIYERGVGGQADYATAAVWYQKAAKQNYPRALVNLGFLYEQGLGVDKDPLHALNLYRQASGLPENSVIYADAARREQDSLREELTRSLQEKDAQIEALQKQLEHAADPQAREVETLRGLVRQLQSDRSHAQSSLTALGTGGHQVGAVVVTGAPQHPAVLDPQTAIKTVMGQNIGRFYALLIGNQNYLDTRAFAKLDTPRNDAERTARLLHDKYGFSVQTIDDADDIAMLRALNELDKVLRPEDNLLIYYAGHGWRTQTGTLEMGFWLPINAEAPPSEIHWVSNMQITAHIGRLAAKRILVLADSCYASLLSSDPSANLFGADGPVSAEYLKYKLPKRARLLLASGGDHPVADAAGKGDSVFARALLDVLEANTGVLSTPGLFVQLRARVQRSATEQSIRQVPDLKSIKEAGHEMGDFFFVPVGKG